MASDSQFLYIGLKIRVTSVKDPNSFYAQIGMPNQLKDFDNFSNNINEWASSCNLKSTSYPRIGSYTLVKSTSTMSEWNRAIVKESLDCGIKVFLIDEGRDQIIDSLDQICGGSPPRLLSVPQQALHCNLMDIQQQTDWSKMDIKEFSNMIDDQQLMCTVYPISCNEMWPIVIYHRVHAEGAWSSVGNSLEKLGIAKYIKLSEVEKQLEKLNDGILPSHPLQDMRTVYSEEHNEHVDNTSVCTQPSFRDSDDSVTDDIESSTTAFPNANNNNAAHCEDDKRSTFAEKGQENKDTDHSNCHMLDDAIIPKVHVPEDSLPTSLSSPNVPIRYLSNSFSNKCGDSSSDDSDINDTEWDDSLLTNNTAIHQEDENSAVKQQNNDHNEFKVDSSEFPLPDSVVPSSHSRLSHQKESKSVVPPNVLHPQKKVTNFVDRKEFGYGQKQPFKKNNPRFAPNFRKPLRENNERTTPIGRGRGHSNHSYYLKFKTTQNRTSYNEQRPFGSNSNPNLQESIPFDPPPHYDSITDDVSNSASCLPQKRQLGGLASVHAVKNETDWLIFKIESEMKKILPTISDTIQFIGDISVILDGPSAHKLVGLTTDFKPFAVVVSIVLKWYLNKQTNIDNAVSVFRDLFVSYQKLFLTVFINVCQESFSVSCENYSGSDVSDKRRLFCFLIEELYLCGITMETTSFIELIVDCVSKFFTNWTTNMSKTDCIMDNCVTYVDCMCILCSTMGVSLDRMNRNTLDKFFEEIIPLIITDNLLTQSLKRQLLDLSNKRTQWLFHLSVSMEASKAIESKQWNTIRPRSIANPTVKSVTRPLSAKAMEPRQWNTIQPCSPRSLPLPSSPGPLPTKTIEPRQWNTIQPCSPRSLPLPASPGLLPTKTIEPRQWNTIQPCSPKSPASSTVKSVTGPFSPIATNNIINSESCYRNVSLMLSKLGLSDLLDLFKGAKIQDSLLLSEKQELKEVLKEACIPPGAILSIAKYLECSSAPMSPNYTNASEPNSLSGPPLAVSSLEQPPPTPSNNDQSCFAQVKFCVMCGSNNHLGYHCPKRSELLFGHD